MVREDADEVWDGERLGVEVRLEVVALSNDLARRRTRHGKTAGTRPADFLRAGRCGISHKRGCQLGVLFESSKFPRGTMHVIPAPILCLMSELVCMIVATRRALLIVKTTLIFVAIHFAAHSTSQ